MTTLWQDVRYGLRRLGKSPGFTAVAVLSLALGIGANTAVFSALNAVLLRSLPVRNPHELRLINWVGRNPQLSSYTGIGTSDTPGGFTIGTSFPYPAYRDFRDQGTGFTDIFAFFAVSKGVTAVMRDDASIAGTLLVSGNFFKGYGVDTLIGRPIGPEDDRPGAAPVAVITYRWWAQRGGLDPAVLGRTLTLNQSSFTIVGVLPRDYVGPVAGDPTDIYVPLAAQPLLVPSRPLDSPNRWWVQIMGRLAPGADEAKSRGSLSLLFRRVLSESSTKMEEPGIVLQDGSRGPLMVRRLVAKPFLALTGVSALVLLVACANLAGLLLARGAACRHEVAVRAALGAGRWRLIRQSLTESLLLSLAGVCLGLLVAAWSKHVLLGFLSTLPDEFRFDLRIDGNVLAFTLGVSLLTALVFGLLPALGASRADPVAGFKSRSTAGRPRLRLGRTLVSVQVGLSVLLVVGAGLMVRTFVNLTRIDPGFDSENLLLLRLSPGQAGYEGSRLAGFYERTHSAVAAIPGVQSVAFSSMVLPGVRRAMTGIDPGVPLTSIRTQAQVLDRSLAQDRLFAWLCGALAELAVLLSCIGLYGLMAYNVARRTGEIGVRMAIGATGAKVAWPILREAAALAGIGVAVGLPVAVVSTRFIESQLYGVAPTDLATLTGTGAMLVVVALLSAWIPARRAARVDPMTALRCE
jgi:predicted permease